MSAAATCKVICNEISDLRYITTNHDSGPTQTRRQMAVRGELCGV